jgi:hypothetical protein
MNESIQVEPFEAKFGDVEMKFHNLKLIFLTEVIIEGTPGITGYTGIFHNVEIHQSAPTGKDCAGEIAIMFRNQGKEFSSCLSSDVIWSLHLKKKKAANLYSLK